MSVRWLYCLVDQGDLHTTDDGMDRYVHKVDYLSRTRGMLSIKAISLNSESWIGTCLHWGRPN